MKKSDKTKQRLIEAATVEFAAFGFAGARVDRIAETSGCNKQAIYAYFGSKDGLFEAVYNEMVVNVISAVPLDAADLSNYAVNLVDYYFEHPEVQRLASWYELEKAGRSPLPSAAQIATKDKIIAISKAQKTGIVSDKIGAEDLLGFILGMAKSSFLGSVSTISAQAAPHVRKALFDAVERLVRP